MDKPERYAIYYEDSRKIARNQAQYGTDWVPDPADYESRADANTLEEVDRLALQLLQEGHSALHLYERYDMRWKPWEWEWEERFVKDLD